MPATFTERIIKPKTQVQHQTTGTNTTLTTKSVEEFFFVAGRSYRGARFYSETVNSFDKAYKIYKDYQGVINYYGGGEVELIALCNEGYKTILARYI